MATSANLQGSFLALDGLPAHVLDRIAMHLGGSDLACLSCTCRRLYDCVEENFMQVGTSLLSTYRFGFTAADQAALWHSLHLRPRATVAVLHCVLHTSCQTPNPNRSTPLHHARSSSEPDAAQHQQGVCPEKEALDFDVEVLHPPLRFEPGLSLGVAPCSEILAPQGSTTSLQRTRFKSDAYTRTVRLFPRMLKSTGQYQLAMQLFPEAQREWVNVAVGVQPLGGATMGGGGAGGAGVQGEGHVGVEPGGIGRALGGGAPPERPGDMVWTRRCLKGDLEVLSVRVPAVQVRCQHGDGVVLEYLNTHTAGGFVSDEGDGVDEKLQQLTSNLRHLSLWRSDSTGSPEVTPVSYAGVADDAGSCSNCHQLPEHCRVAASVKPWYTFGRCGTSIWRLEGGYRVWQVQGQPRQPKDGVYYNAEMHVYLEVCSSAYGPLTEYRLRLQLVDWTEYPRD